MIRATILAALLISCPAIAVNKCKDAAGKISYSDIPCAGNTGTKLHIVDNKIDGSLDGKAANDRYVQQAELERAKRDDPDSLLSECDKAKKDFLLASQSSEKNGLSAKREIYYNSCKIPVEQRTKTSTKKSTHCSGFNFGGGFTTMDCY